MQLILDLANLAKAQIMHVSRFPLFQLRSSSVIFYIMLSKYLQQNPLVHKDIFRYGNSKHYVHLSASQVIHIMHLFLKVTQMILISDFKNPVFKRADQ